MGGGAGENGSSPDPGLRGSVRGWRFFRAALPSGLAGRAGILQRSAAAFADRGTAGPGKTQQSFVAKRTFSVPAPGDIPFGAKAPSGDVATFQLRILFRQNASWQGSVAWTEGRREESFRSVLELLLLMNSAMECGEPGRGTAKAR